MKAMKAALAKRPAANLKNNGRWLWLGVLVGKGNNVTVFNHPDKTKRPTYRFLPRAADAEDGSPRGLDEIKNTLQEYIKKGTFLIFDGWTSTQSAVRKLGFNCAPPVVHERNWRDPATGFHINDAESENARLKMWNRRRHGHLRLRGNDMAEYVFYVNLGDSVSSVMQGLAAASGGSINNHILR